jgi:hypothetical protein
MEVMPRFEVKEVGQCKVGELVRYGTDNVGRLGVVARGGENMLVFLLDADEKELRFCTVPVADHGRCVSYGVGWVVELLEGMESWPGNPIHADTLGVVRHLPGSTSIVGREGKEGLWLFDLEKFKPSTRQRYEGAPILNWRIWHSVDESNRPEGRPVYEYQAK